MELDARIAEFIHSSWQTEGQLGQPMVTSVIVAASMLDGEGDEVWAFYPMGDGGATAFVGLLEMTKAQIIDQAMYETEDEDEDYG